MKLKSTSKALAKALSPLPNRSLRSSVAAALILHFTFYILHSPAAEPLSWVRKPNQPAPAQFDTFHGESLDFRCTFTGFGALPFAGVSGESLSESGALAPRLYYQTNGMGAAWWSLPATVSSNALSATFPPSADPGAERLTVFFGAPSNAYAAAQVRFRNSPGAHPNDLDPPSVLDWQAELAAATNALWESSAAELREKADVSRTVVFTNSIIVPEMIGGGNWTYGNSIAGFPTGDLVRDAALTASATDGSIYWSAQTEYYIVEYGDTTFYRYAIAWYNPYLGTFEAAVWSDIMAPMPRTAAEIEGWDMIGDFRSMRGLPWPQSFATLDTPEPDELAWEGSEYIPMSGSASAGVPTQAVETVVYSLDLATATNALHKSLAPTISNTVTKAYVESLGIESGISASTATNIAEAVVEDKRDVTDLAVYVYSPWHLYNGVKLEWNQDGVYGEGWYGSYGPDDYSLTFTNGVWRYNDAVAGTCEVTNDFSVKVLLFEDYGSATRTSIFSTNGQYIVTSDEIETLASTNYADTAAADAVAAADTSYPRYTTITNLNQSVQYVQITDTTPSTLEIQLPTDGATKDWMVYVVSVTNVTLSLPSATWWMADVAYTNDVPPATPTALWFSQITDGIFILGRQELTEVTAP